MRTRRILVVALAVLASGLFASTPAQAGNWEETLLDPPPARIEVGVTYTFGYWVLQHGSYPYKGGDLGRTALRATDENGEAVDFPGTESATAGHYSAEVVFPHNGTWTISSQHAVIMPDPNVAVVTVPGAVAVTPSDMIDRGAHEWGAVRPSFPPAAPDAQNAPPVQETEVAPRGHATVDAPAGTRLPVWVVVLGGVATVGLALLLIRRFRRVRA